MCFSKQLTKRVFHFENKKKLFFSFSLKNKKTKIENENSYQTWPNIAAFERRERRERKGGGESSACTST